MRMHLLPAMASSLSYVVCIVRQDDVGIQSIFHLLHATSQLAQPRHFAPGVKVVPTDDPLPSTLQQWLDIARSTYLHVCHSLYNSYYIYFSTTIQQLWGVWLSPYEAERRHDVRFDTEFVSRGCQNEYIVSEGSETKEISYTFPRNQWKSTEINREINREIIKFDQKSEA